jgi:hypothetical protein
VGAQRSFNAADQLRFARLSGDRNPLHIDAGWAATVFPGGPVVHGVHLVLWALETLWDGEDIPGLTATFIKPVLQGDSVTAVRDCDRLTMRIRGEPMLVMRVAPAARHAQADSGRPAQSEWHGRAGVVDLGGESGLLRDMFPRLSATLGEERLAGLIGLSTLVGMHCPGLHGMLAEFAVSPGGGSDLHYRVVEFDQRFSRILISVEGIWSGVVAAFVTPPQQPLPSDESLRTLVDAREFTGARPVVIGGSSGLGAVTALLLAAGGARPIVTYHANKTSAEEIARRAEGLGTTCGIVQLDVTRHHEAFAALTAEWRGNQLYYFATSRIFRRRVELYQKEDLRDFLDIHVDGFYDLVRDLIEARSGRPLSVFYPSTEAVVSGPADLFEYAQAKRIGELVCAKLAKKYPALSMVVERLPRTDTRQTRSFARARAEKPEDVMLPIVRRMQGSR